MEVKGTLFMNKGDGRNSYVHNSPVAQRVASMTQPELEETVRSLFSKDSDFHGKALVNVADLGCASGPNTFLVMSTVASTAEKICKELNFKIPEIQFYLNDLPGNDFNTLFSGLSGFGERNKDAAVPLFVMGVPGSSHGRLFPKNTMHLIHSSYCVHWLSKAPKLTSEGGVPLNKGKMYISKTSPAIVREAYMAQFHDDFSWFLKSRSQEMVPKGRIIMAIHGRSTPDPTTKESCYLWELLAAAITQLVSQGLIDEEKLDSLNMPYYSPSTEEVQGLVEMEGSFATERVEMLTTDSRDVWAPDSGSRDAEKMAEAGARNIRAFTESVIAHQFGPNLMDELYGKFVKNILLDDLSEGPVETTSILIVLKKLD